jgi:hypothetical protein
MTGALPVCRVPAMSSVVAQPVRDHELAEEDLVVLWRISRLIEAGYDDTCAVEIACSTIDLHVAVGLLERGCPQEIAIRILF